jgi:peptidoglycan/LPS O-acetylase OafA/YrhL
MVTPPNRFVQLLALWTALLIGLNLTIGSTESALLNVLLSPLNLEFITGCFIGVVIRKRIWVSPKVIIAIGLLWFSVGVLANAKGFANFDLHWTRLIAFGLPSGLILYTCCALEDRDNNHLPAIFQKLGDTSYSIYLTHLTLFSAVRRYSHGSEVAFGPEYGALMQFAWNMLMLLSAFGGGIAVYYLVEVPLLKFLRSLFVRKREPLLFTEGTTGTS